MSLLDWIFRRGRERELEEEIQSHLEMAARDRMESGESSDEARHSARREFGSTMLVKEVTREMWGWGRVERLLQDIRYSLRQLRKSPGFAALAIITLALGIGAATAIYSVVYNVLLHPLPYKDSEQIEDLLIQDYEHDQHGGALPIPEFLDFEEQSDVFKDVVGSHSDVMLYTFKEGTEPVDVAWVTPNTFRFCGVSPLLGRSIDAVDGKPGAPPVCDISYSAWVGRFGRSPSVLGRTMVLNGTPYMVIGVMPPRFAWQGRCEAWIPKTLDRSDPAASRTYWWFQARLKPGVTREEATAELNVIAHHLASVHPELYPKRFSVILKSPVDFVVGRFRGVLYSLMAAVGLLLLIACSNVANMLLARATAREKEISIRAALGAGRWRLVRQVLTESALLSVGGAAAGCLFAAGGLKLLLRIVPEYTIPVETRITLSVPVLLFSLAAAMVTALLFGIAPAFHSMRKDLADGLRDTGKEGTGSSRYANLRYAMVAGEVALSLTLLVSAVLLMRTFFALTQADLGFSAKNVLVTYLAFPPGQYKTAAERSAMLGQVMPRVASLPGVLSAAVANHVPPYGGLRSEVEIPGRTHIEKWNTLSRLCSEAYFQTLGIPLLHGRLFSPSDVSSRRHLAIVNRTFATRYLGREDPLGKQIILPSIATAPDPVTTPAFEITGVVGDTKNEGIQEPVSPEVFLPYTLTAGSAQGVLILVRTSVDSGTLAGAVRREIWSADRGLGLSTFTVTSLLNSFDYAQPRFSLALVGVFAGVGLFLVGIGIYGAISYTVSRQTHEIGIRVALGATQGDIIRGILRLGARVLAAGIAAGLIATLAAGRLIANQLWHVSPYDPFAIGGGIAVVAFAALAACLVPAFRATRVDPMTALRSE
jgi:putative ABC transport system permease protein